MALPMTVHLALLLLLATLDKGIHAAPTAACSQSNCQAPDCRCLSSDAPGGIPLEQVPQIVLLTFDDAMVTTVYHYYYTILQGRTNPNGCPISLTFFVSHQYSDYKVVNDMHYHGNEIASHSITHHTDPQSWKDQSYDDWVKEIVGQRTILSHFANISKSEIRGMRSPYLAMGGDTMFRMLKDNEFLWDCSWPTQAFAHPPIWPYTLDFPSPQDCEIGLCPTGTYPGVWEVPMSDMKGNSGGTCSMADACVPEPTTKQEAYTYLLNNFWSHYNTSKAPYGIFLHASWFIAEGKEIFEGYLQFVDYILNLPDVWVVGVTQALDWIRNPVPLSNIPSFQPWQCPTTPKTPNPTCTTSQSCTFQNAPPSGGYESLNCCAETCPANYPWLGNPLGQ